MTVLELARKSGEEPHVIRYYTRMGLPRPAVDPRNSYRVYEPLDVARVRFIRKAQGLGFTLKEIARIFDESRDRESPCPGVREIIKRRIEENRRKLDELARLQTRMERADAPWSKMPDGVPDGQSVCHLIESVADEV